MQGEYLGPTFGQGRETRQGGPRLHLSSTDVVKNSKAWCRVSVSSLFGPFPFSGLLHRLTPDSIIFSDIYVSQLPHILL